MGKGVAEGEILSWLVKEGDVVKEGQSLVEVMTKKVTFQIPAPKNGTIAKLLVKEGETVHIGHGILVIEIAGQEIPVGETEPSPAPAEPRVAQTP